MVLDGEAVCCDPDGTANFEKLHSQAHNERVFLYAFDLLELGGIDLRIEPLEERRRRGRFQHLLRKVTDPGVQFNEHIEGEGATIFEHA
jgi:ATP-dependent DNA ligase